MGIKSKIVVFALIALGLGVLLYPAISSAVNRRSGSYAIQEWEAQVRNLENDELNRQMEQAEAFNDALRSGEEPEGYHRILDFGNGMIGYIRIPSIKVDLPIYHGVEEDVLSRGAGHLPESSFPIGREGDHAVITGHTGLPSARLFTDLTKLQKGDLFYVRVLDRELCYAVDNIQVVLPSESGALAAVPGEDLCTLVTCTPYGVNSHRLLVRGTRVEAAPAPAIPTLPEMARGYGWHWWLLGLPLLGVSGWRLWKHFLDGRKKPAYNGKYLKREKER